VRAGLMVAHPPMQPTKVVGVPLSIRSHCSQQRPMPSEAACALGSGRVGQVIGRWRAATRGVKAVAMG
jgi:hypothetical protein